MEKFLSGLLAARNAAHIFHWNTRSFSLHLALGELYELLSEVADELAEMYMGTAGAPLDIKPSTIIPDNVNDFINSLLIFVDEEEKKEYPEFIINYIQEIHGKVSQIKYKIDNLN